jgi:predicted PolB exonuclease-like 3'-5' exonuclease
LGGEGVSNIFIDLETLPDQSAGAVERIAKTLTVKAPDLTKPKLINALGLGDDSKYTQVAELKEMWVDKFGAIALLEQAKEKWLKTSFDGGYGQICCIGFDIGDTPYVLTDKEYSEAEIIKQFWDIVGHKCKNTTPYFIAHNAKFDLPFLHKRSVIGGVTPNGFFRPHGRNGSDYYCTSETWAGYGNRISLDNLAKILGVKGKMEGMDGSQVWPEYQKGNIDKIAEYCAEDVRTLKDVYSRMEFK